MDEWMNGRMNGWINGWMTGGWVDGKEGSKTEEEEGGNEGEKTKKRDVSSYTQEIFQKFMEMYIMKNLRVSVLFLVTKTCALVPSFHKTFEVPYENKLKVFNPLSAYKNK